MKKRTGAASFYIVAISTLLFTIIAMSFAAVVIAELSRTTNSDLSQSAYDSALAGIEDAKVAILNYQNCLNQGATAASSISLAGNVSCGEIIYYMEHPDCDMVGHILNRIPKSDPAVSPNSGTEVLIQETKTGDNNMEQAYTCVKIAQENPDYRGTITEGEYTRVVPIKITNADAAKSIRVKWYSDANRKKANTNLAFVNTSGNSVIFPALTPATEAKPPVMAVQLVQTSTNFNLGDELDISRMTSSTSGQSDTGMIFLVPTNQQKSAHSTDANRMDVTKDNTIKNSDPLNFASSNSKTMQNIPALVKCGEPGTASNDAEFSCSVSIELPSPVKDEGEGRNPDTFMLVLSLPYGQPETDFAVEVCDTATCQDANRLSFLNQVGIDSTGRANDLYRRIEARVENITDNAIVPSFAVQLLNDQISLRKTMVVKTEYGVYNQNSF